MFWLRVRVISTASLVLDLLTQIDSAPHPYFSRFLSHLAFALLDEKIINYVRKEKLTLFIIRGQKHAVLRLDLGDEKAGS